MRKRLCRGTRHAVATREVTLHQRLPAVAHRGSVRPIACRPHRALTRDKHGRGVGYVKHHALAGHTVASCAALVALLADSTRDADAHACMARRATPRSGASRAGRRRARTARRGRQSRAAAGMDAERPSRLRHRASSQGGLGAVARSRKDGPRPAAGSAPDRAPGGSEHRRASGAGRHAWAPRREPARFVGLTARAGVALEADPPLATASCLLAEYAGAAVKLPCGAAAERRGLWRRRRWSRRPNPPHGTSCSRGSSGP